LLDTRCGTNGRNPEDGKDWRILTIVQQVLKVALLFPVLERGILLSSREGVWDRVRKGLVPFEAGGWSRQGIFRTASPCKLINIELRFYKENPCVSMGLDF
jgi:hypothetical protein